jgi:hypothetical protein
MGNESSAPADKKKRSRDKAPPVEAPPARPKRRVVRKRKDPEEEEAPLSMPLVPLGSNTKRRSVKTAYKFLDTFNKRLKEAEGAEETSDTDGEEEPVKRAKKE